MRLCAERGIPTVVVPGPSAVISALCVSGLITSRFCFEGFLSTAKKSRREHLEAIKNEPRTMIFYEAPHKLQNTLQDLLDALGDRKTSIARELTKLHEEVLRFSLSQAVEYYVNTPPRGEFVLVVEGASQPQEQAMTLADAVELAKQLEREGQRPADAAKAAAKQSGFKKSEIYQGLLREKQEG